MVNKSLLVLAEKAVVMVFVVLKPDQTVNTKQKYF